MSCPTASTTATPTNDKGGLVGDRLVTGFDPTDKGFYHGGDLAGLIDKLEYLDNLGVTAIWMTPMFKNRPVQGTAPDISAGYHGYWITDFTQFDPHFGTNAELETLIAEAHSRGIKVFFDIILTTRRTFFSMRKTCISTGARRTSRTATQTGTVFDDRDYLGTGTFPALDPAVSFPYTPVTPPEFTGVKVPAWLNNPIYYHNRGNSTFAGENSLYGDFFGLDDLFTEHPEVVTGMTDIYKYWVENYDIDGFRIDTVKHVNAEFWQEFTPAILASAAGAGSRTSSPLARSSAPTSSCSPTTPPGLTCRPCWTSSSRSKRAASLPKAAAQRAWQRCSPRTTTSPTTTPMSMRCPPSWATMTWGASAISSRLATAGASDADLLARDKLAHGLMYFARGVPVVYYGDEQGFVGDGGDKDARQDMMPSQVDSYNDDDLIGTDTTTADANFDPTHPLYQAYTDFAAVRAAHPALRNGAQIHRYADSGPGVYAFSRIDRTEQIEYVLAFNNGGRRRANVPTFYGGEPGSSTSSMQTAGRRTPRSTPTLNGELPVRVPAKGFVIYQAARLSSTRGTWRRKSPSAP